MGFLCLLGGPISNRIGLNWTLCLGAVGYPVYSYVRIIYKWIAIIANVFIFYSAGLYTNNRYVKHTQFFTFELY